MTQYITTIIYICIFSVILELILPDNKLKKYVGVLVSFIVIITLISPIINVLENEQVVETISRTIESIQSKISVNEYNFNNLENRLIFSSVKENLQQDLYTKCTEKFGKRYKISKVKIILNSGYKIEDIDIYVNNLNEVANAGEIIDFVANTYKIDAAVINVIREE